MTIPIYTVDDLAVFAGRTVHSYSVLGDYVTEALSQASLIFSLVTGLTDMPTDPSLAELAKKGILQLAEKIYQDRLWFDGERFQSETIGSYTYSYSKLIAKVKASQDFGLFWFDMAVDKLAIWDEGSQKIWSTGISIFENDGVVRVGRHRWIPGPAAYAQIIERYLTNDPSSFGWYLGGIQTGEVYSNRVGWNAGEGDYIGSNYPPISSGGGGGSDNRPTTADDEFVFHQHDPSTEWVIHHYMGGFPTVVVKDYLGDVKDVLPQYVDNNTLIIHVNPALAGMAILNI